MAVNGASGWRNSFDRPQVRPRIAWAAVLLLPFNSLACNNGSPTVEPTSSPASLVSQGSATLPIASISNAEPRDITPA